MPGPKQSVNTTPSGTGTIETYCVAYGKDAPERGYIFGRLDGSGERFVAMTPNDPALLAGHAEAANSSAAGSPSASKTAATSFDLFSAQFRPAHVFRTASILLAQITSEQDARGPEDMIMSATPLSPVRHEPFLTMRVAICSR